MRRPIQMDAPLMRCRTDQGKACQTLAAVETLVEPHFATARMRHIAIDVRVDGDEISGQAGDGAGRPWPFRGWLGLIGVLDRLLANPAIDQSH